MKYRIVILVELLLLVFSSPPFASTQIEANKSSKNEAAKTDEKKDKSTVSVNIKISAEGKSSVPLGSTIEWQGVGENCRNVTGTKNLEPVRATPVNLPACKVKLTVFITGFDTKAVTVDVWKNKEKYKDPIQITIRHQGPAEVDW